MESFVAVGINPVPTATHNSIYIIIILTTLFYIMYIYKIHNNFNQTACLTSKQMYVYCKLCTAVSFKETLV